MSLLARLRYRLDARTFDERLHRDLIAHLEEHKCGICKHWTLERDNPCFGECSQLDDINTHENFFCAYWQPRREPI